MRRAVFSHYPAGLRLSLTEKSGADRAMRRVSRGVMIFLPHA